MESLLTIILMILSITGNQAGLSVIGVTDHSFTSDAYQYPESKTYVVSPGACIFLFWDVVGADSVTIMSNDGEVYENLPAKGDLLVQPSTNIDYYVLSVDGWILDTIKMYRSPSTHYPANQAGDFHDPSCDRESR